MAADISLLFGVLGEGSLSGDSGKLIQNQLTQIMSELNKNPLKVKVGIDTNAGGKKSWSSQLQEKLDKVSASGKFSAQISTLKLSSGAVSDFKKQLTAIVNTVGLSTGTQITITAEGIGDIKGKLKEAQDAIKKTGDSATEASNKLAEFKVQMEALNGQKNAVKKSLDNLGQNATTEAEKTQIAEITARYEQWAIKIEAVRAAKSAIPADQRAAIEAEGAAILTNIERLNTERIAREEVARAAEDTASRKADAEKKESASQEQKNAALRTGITLLTQMEKAERDWTAAQIGSSKQNYAGLQSDIASLKEYKRQLESGEITVEDFRRKLGELQASFSANSNAIKGAGENMRTLSARIGNLAQKFSAWLSVSQVIMLGIRSIRRMVSATIELDDAMTQLKIVTRDTSQAYEEYLGKITQTATKIGSAVPDLIDSTTTFARLGYSLEESSALAEFTAMLQNVGDIDVADAQDAITAIVKAFGISVDEVESIMDKLVITGNNFPISVSQIAEGMNNASSALAAAGNTFEQSVALLTAANTTIQNAAKSSTGLRTIAARLRSTKTELDELGETMTEAEYGDLIAALTKYNVALTDMNGEFRSTYDIVADIAAIWDELSTMEQAALANAIAGVRQQSVFFSMVEQFQEASGAMEDMANSAGTLQKSYATFMESTTAHINQFKAAFQSLSQSTFTADFLNGIIDFGTGILKILNAVSNIVNAVGGLNTVLYTTVGLMATLNADALFGQLRRLTIPIQSLILNIGVFNEAFASAFAASSIAGATKMTGVVSGLSAGFKALTASATTAQLAVGGVFAAFAAITLVVKLYDALTVSAEEATEQMEKSFSEFEDAANKAENLSDELENVRDRISELEAQDSLTFVEESELQKLRESVELLQIQADLAEKERIREAKEAAADTVTAYRKNFKYDITSDAVQGYIDSSSSTGNNAILFSDESNISAMLAGIEQMKRLRDELDKSGENYQEDYQHFQGIIDDATGSLENQIKVLSTYKANLEAIPYNELTDEQKAALDEVNEAIALVYSSLDPAKWKDIQWNNIINSEQYSDDAKALKSLASEATITADTIKEKFPALAKACEDAGLAIDDVANNLNSSFAGANVNDDGLSAYTANLSDLSDVLSGLKSSYDILADAQNEMSTDGGLSPETIEKLANAEENYLDYLYEENGVVKLNIEAWKERANAKMLDEMDEIQKEIDSLNEENAALEELIATYEEKRLAALEAQNLTAYYDYYHEIDNLNAKIQENNAVIEENQGKLAVYSSLYGAITGDLDAYASSLQNFSRIANAIDSISNSFQTLADLQATVANGFTMSLDKALEFAKVYPEILNNATAAADGQITLNEDVVNSFIQGKKAEIDAQIDAQIAQLEADKAVLEARMEFSKAELDLAKQVGEGEADIAKEVAEFRLDTANKLVAALIEAGIDEATAFQLACAAMAGNAEEFDRIAMEVCTDVNGNFNEAAYQAAQAIYQNMNSAKKDVASLATQAQQTAEAIAGMADGIKAGSSAIVGGSGGGTTGNGITLNLTGADFKGTDYTYEAKDIGLDDFISDLELDISNYENAIAQIDGQIAALQALKDAPLKSFQSERNGGGAGSDPDNAVKEVEEYIASIEDYREAIERLNRIQLNKANLETQLSNEGDLKKQIELQKELVSIYEDEQDALHVLNDLRDETITESVDSLRNLGFDVEYDADANEFFVKNLEHINELVADNKGEYDTLQEATNALRQETEGLIDTLIELNEANQDGSASWMELAYAIQEANIAIYENTVKERENMIKLTENWLEAAIGENETERVEQYTKDIVSYYKDMQETIHQEVEYYRSLGYSETSDEVSALSDLWWDYEGNIRDVKQNVIDYLADIVTAASEMVDEIQNVFDVLKSAADEYADNGGFISVDTLQDIIALGPQYMQYLRDENGLLVINEEAINRVIAAKTQQLALENALSYVERLRLALEEGSIENLNQLLFATTDATNATWGLVYANLALLDLDENQYQAALHNINSLRAIADTTVENIGMVTGAAAKAAEEAEKAAEEAAKAAQKELETLRDELENMKSAGDDIIKYVMDMLKHRIQQQIDALKEMKTAYSEIIKLKKESLKATKAENDYQKSVAAKVKEMAELQAKMDALSLDSSRDAQAERASLAEKMAELQEDLADKQADYALDATMDSLDKMEEEYHKEKDKEIEILEESISSYQKLYDMAIEYISTHWDTLYSELIAWNTEYGSVLNSEITDAWNNCLAAAERYGSFVDAMLGGIEAEIASINAQIESLNLSSSGSGSSGSPGTTTSGVSASNNVVVGATKDYENEYTSGYAAKITDLVAQMRENSSKWHTTSDTRERNRLHEDSVTKANMISRLGVVASYDPKKGTWTIVSDKWNPSNVGQNLLSSYHTGGFAGVQPTLKQNEIMAVLEKGEAILDAKKEQALYRLIDFATVLSERMSRVLSSSDAPALADGIRSGVEMPGRDTLSNITNSNQTKVEFGDMYIYGANEKTVEQHREVNRKFANDILEQLKIKR